MWPQTEIQDLPQLERLSLKEVMRPDDDQIFQRHCFIKSIQGRSSFRDRGARWKVGGLTTENNFFMLKSEKRSKTFDNILKCLLVKLKLTIFTASSCRLFCRAYRLDEVRDNSNKRPTYTVSSDSMQEKTRLQF